MTTIKPTQDFSPQYLMAQDFSPQYLMTQDFSLERFISTLDGLPNMTESLTTGV